MAGRSLIFGEDDRDEAGRLRVAPGRTLAELLPETPESAPPATARPTPGVRVQLALGAIVVAVLFVVWFAMRPGAPPAPLAVAAAATPSASAPPVATASATASATTIVASPTPACTLLQTTATFYAPGGAPAPIAAERGQACQVLAWHAGYPDWRQIRIDGGSPVWVPVAVLSTAARSGPDLAPPPTATPAPAPPTAVVIVERVVVTAVPCDTPRYTARLDTIVDGIPIGYVIGESCGSQAEADARAATLREQAEAAYRATHSPTPTPQPDLGSASYQATDMAIVSRLHDSPTPTRRPL